MHPACPLHMTSRMRVAVRHDLCGSARANSWLRACGLRGVPHVAMFDRPLQSAASCTLTSTCTSHCRRCVARPAVLARPATAFHMKVAAGKSAMPWSSSQRAFAHGWFCCKHLRPQRMCRRKLYVAMQLHARTPTPQPGAVPDVAVQQRPRARRSCLAAWQSEAHVLALQLVQS